MAKVLIAGCGAIGSELAGVLSAQGHQVTGLKRKPPAVAPGCINYVAADISSPADMEALAADFTQAFFIVSPDGRNEQSYSAVYQSGLNNLLAKFPETPWIMVSSTSVYAQSQGEWVDEDSIAQPGNITSRLIRLAEQKLTALNPANIVVRFSGIYGPGRNYLLRQAMQTPGIQQTPPYFTNRIHQLDCVGVLSFLLEQRLTGKTLAQCYLASDDNPAPMWEVMTWLADRLHCLPPSGISQRDADFAGSKISAHAVVPITPFPSSLAAGEEVRMNKRCSNARLKALGYRFQYPSYQDGYSELIRSQKDHVDQ